MPHLTAKFVQDQRVIYSGSMEEFAGRTATIAGVHDVTGSSLDKYGQYRYILVVDCDMNDCTHHAGGHVITRVRESSLKPLMVVAK